MYSSRKHAVELVDLNALEIVFSHQACFNKLKFQTGSFDFHDPQVRLNSHVINRRHNFQIFRNCQMEHCCSCQENIQKRLVGDGKLLENLLTNQTNELSIMNLERRKWPKIAFQERCRYFFNYWIYTNDGFGDLIDLNIDPTLTLTYQAPSTSCLTTAVYNQGCCPANVYISRVKTISWKAFRFSLDDLTRDVVLNKLRFD